MTVKINRTAGASQQLVDQASQGTSVNTAGGVAIGLKHPGVLAQFRLVKMLGGETSRNDVYVRMVLPMLYVHTIGGEDVPALSSELEIEALIQRLGEEGVAAVIKGVQEKFEQRDPEEVREEIKK